MGWGDRRGGDISYRGRDEGREGVKGRGAYSSCMVGMIFFFHNAYFCFTYRWNKK